MAKFGSFKFGQAKFGTGDSDPSPEPDPVVTEGRVAWLFTDGVTGHTSEFEINPSRCQIPSITKSTSSQITSAGRQVIYSGRREAGQMVISGTILSESQYRVMQIWANANRQIRITDDLGRRYWIYVLSFEPQRQRAIEYPWRMDYNLTGVILDWSAA